MRRSWILVGLVVSLVGTSFGQNSTEYVAKVMGIDGSSLTTNRRTEGRWFQAYSGMKSYLTERLRTGEQTSAMLEFAIGGRAGINRNTEIEIVGLRDVETVGNKIVVKTGTMWAKIDKQKKRLQIQTAGGVIGVEGTELLVAHDPETKVSEVLLFEGRITLTDDKGNKKTMNPGDYASLGGPSGMCVLSYPPTSLRTLIVERFPRFSSYLAQYDVATIPKPASPTLIRGFLKPRPGLYELLAVSNDTLVTDPAEFASGAGSDRLTGLQPSQTNVGGKPNLSWDAFPGAESYQVVLAADENMDDIAFSGVAEQNSLDIPAGAPGIGSGKYFYRVIPLDKDGKPMGRASQTWFETTGWESQGVALAD